MSKTPPCNNCGPYSYAYLSTYYPSKCGCKSGNSNSCECVYTGPNLPWSGVNTGDDFNTVVQKLDNALNPSDLANNILLAIQSSETLQILFCALADACTTTTTSTTTSSTTSSTTTTTTTTSTTTTAFPGYYTFNFLYNPSISNCLGSPVTMYSPTDLTTYPRFLYTDPGLTTGAPLGYYCFASGCPNPTGFSIVQVTGPAPGEILTMVGC